MADEPVSTAYYCGGIKPYRTNSDKSGLGVRHAAEHRSTHGKAGFLRALCADSSKAGSCIHNFGEDFPGNAALICNIR